MAIILVQGDTAPDLLSVIHPEDDVENPIDLTGASVRFQMRKPDDRLYTVDAPAHIVNAGQGYVSYSWAPNDLAVPGTYGAQWEVTYNDGKIQTTAVPIELFIRRQ